MEFTDILYEKAQGLATITFNRPEKMNAARPETHREFAQALDDADADDAVRAVIVTGSGPRAFCAGTDLSAGTWSSNRAEIGDPATGKDVIPDVAAVGPLRIWDMHKPVIGAINGVAVGFGASVLCSMDMRIAAEGARVGFVYARRGICNESCSSFFLPRVVGIGRAMEWVATGRMVAAEEMKAAGFANQVVPAGQLLDAARALGREIADNCAPAGVAVSRQLMWNMLSADSPHQATDFEMRGLTGLMRLPDSKEGVRSFVEKRPPKFTGSAVKDTAFAAGWRKR